MPEVAPSSTTTPVLSVADGARLNDRRPGPKHTRKPDRPGTAERRVYRRGASAKASISLGRRHVADGACSGRPAGGGLGWLRARQWAVGVAGPVLAARRRISALDGLSGTHDYGWQMTMLPLAGREREIESSQPGRRRWRARRWRVASEGGSETSALPAAGSTCTCARGWASSVDKARE
jgi:hypothetical protein